MGGQLDFVSFRLSLLGQRKSVLWSAHPQGVRIHAPLQSSPQCRELLMSQSHYSRETMLEERRLRSNNGSESGPPVEKSRSEPS
jgi:hypothetical protein